MSEIQSIATNNYILATQQEVSHDSSLSGNGTVDSPLGVVPGYNETVLWDGNNTPSASITLSEPISNFSLIRLTFRAWDRNICIFKDTIDTGTNSLQCSVSWAQDNGIVTIGYVYSYNNSTKTITKGSGFAYRISGNAFQTQNTGDEHCGIVKVIGINRKAQ